MRKQLLSCFSILFLGINLTGITYAQPLNLSCEKRQLIDYYHDLSADSGYIKDVNTVITDAEQYLNSRVAENNSAAQPAKLAIVLDIDDTSLSNYPSIKTDDFSNAPALIDARYRAANAPAIAPVMRLFNEAVAKNIAVFFITVRRPLDTTPSEDLRPYTIQNLQKAGYVGWTELYLPQGDDLKLSTADYKTKTRKMITDAGYDIILNVGDQDSDLVGGYADHTDKVPNYLYSTSPTPCDAKGICAK